MPVTLSPPNSASQPLEADTQAGVIRDARRRQRRRRTSLAALGVLAAVLLLWLLGGGSGGASPRGRGPLFPQRPLHLAFLDGQPYMNGEQLPLLVFPSLQAGNTGLCVTLDGTGSCNGAYAGPGTPLFGDEGDSPELRVGPRGEIDYALTAPAVAAVRVSGIGTLRPISMRGLPARDGLVVFYRPPGSRGTVLPPGAGREVIAGLPREPHSRRPPAVVTLTPLDRFGHPIPQDPAGSRRRLFQLPNSYWQASAKAPADASCALSSTLTGVSVEWGQVATRIAADEAAPNTAFFTCMQVWYRYRSTDFQAALLLDGHSPGHAPKMLWGAKPLVGQPGVFRVPAIYGPRLSAREKARIRSEGHGDDIGAFEQPREPETLLRREGPALLLVRYGRTLSERLAFLKALRVTRIALPGAVTGGRRHAGREDISRTVASQQAGGSCRRVACPHSWAWGAIGELASEVFLEARHGEVDVAVVLCGVDQALLEQALADGGQSGRRLSSCAGYVA
jgi:hypothetical protein